MQKYILNDKFNLRIDRKEYLFGQVKKGSEKRRRVDGQNDTLKHIKSTRTN